MIKRIIALFLLTAQLFALVSCGTAENKESETAPETTAVQTEPAPRRLSDEYVVTIFAEEMIEISDFYKISVDEGVNALVKNYSVTCVCLADDQSAAEKIFNKSYLDTYRDEYDLNNVYYCEVTGDLMLNPDIPYYTDRQTVVYCIMAFDEKGNLIEGSDTLSISNDFQTSLLVYMSKQINY